MGYDPMFNVGVYTCDGNMYSEPIKHIFPSLKEAQQFVIREKLK